MLRSLVALSGTLLGNTVEITHNVAHWGDEQNGKCELSAVRYGFSGLDFLPIATEYL